MSMSPERPAQPMAMVTGGTGKQRWEQVLDLVAGQPDSLGWWRAGAVGQGGDPQEGVGEHGQGGLAVPGPPAADLMGVQATKALAGLEALLDGPAPPGDSNQGGQRHRVGHEAAVEGQLAGLAVAADQQPALPSLTARCRVAVVQADERPVVVAVALGALTGRDALPSPRRDPPEEGVGAPGVTGGEHPMVTGHRQHLADTAALQLGPQPRVGAVDLIAGHQAAGTPASRARASILVARPAWWQSRPGRGCRPPGSGPGPGASLGAHTAPGRSWRARPHWHRPGRPRPGHSRCGQRCRCPDAAPDRLAALLEIAGLVDDQHRLGITQVLDQVPTEVVADPSWSHTARLSRCCIHLGWHLRRARQSSSSSYGAGRPPARTRTPWPAGVAPPGRTGPPPSQQLLQPGLPAARVNL